MEIKDAVGQNIIIHMTNGQPVIGKLLEFDEETDTMVVNQAMEVHFMPNPQRPGAVSVQYTPFLAFGGVLPVIENMPINHGDTLLVRVGAGVPKTIEDGYLQAISKVQIATAGTMSSLVNGSGSRIHK